jgi:hypothetical protein
MGLTLIPKRDRGSSMIESERAFLQNTSAFRSVANADEGFKQRRELVGDGVNRTD